MTQANAQQWEGHLSGPLPVAINARWAERLLLSYALTAVDVVMILSGFRLAYALRFEVGISWFASTESRGCRQT